MLNSFFKGFTNSIGRTLGKIFTYILIALLLFILFGKGVKADTYEIISNDIEIQGYNNNGSSLTLPSQYGYTADSYAMKITTNANSYGGAFAIESPIALIKNHTYSLTIRIKNSSDINIVQSAKNRIALGSSISSAKYNYENNNYYNTLDYSSAIGNYALQFAFTVTGNSSHILIPFTTSSTTTTDFFIDSLVIDDLGSGGVSSADINNSLNSQTNQINSSINNSTNTITGAIDDVEQSINNNIKDNFNSCRDSYNLLYKATSKTENGISFNVQSDGSIIINGTATGTASINLTNNSNGSISLSPNTYTLSGDFSGGSDTTFRMCTNATGANLCTYGSKITFTVSNNVNDRAIWFVVYSGTTLNNLVLKPMLNVGSTALPYEPQGEICKNKLDEANETSKGIWDTIKSFPSTFSKFFTDLGDKIGGFFDNLLTGIINGLKSLFIPQDGYFEDWFNDLKTFFEEKLGFLATPFTIFIDFINRFLNINVSDDIIINIPNISVPNFEDYKIISATSLNWSDLLRSKESLNTLWQLYLSFIDVILIVKFINLCQNKYNQIFGGDVVNDN